jgi:toxin CptA
VLTHRIEISPSVRLAVALCATHFAAAAATAWAAVPLWVKAPVVMAIAASLVYYLARVAALHSADAIVALEIHDDGGVACRTRRGEWLEGELLGSSYVSSQLTIIGVRLAGRRARHVVLVPDNVDPRDFRRLRVWLRWAAAGERG